MDNIPENINRESDRDLGNQSDHGVSEDKDINNQSIDFDLIRSAVGDFTRNDLQY